jgi:hypothetical protein
VGGKRYDFSPDDKFVGPIAVSQRLAAVGERFSREGVPHPQNDIDGLGLDRDSACRDQ